MSILVAERHVSALKALTEHIAGLLPGAQITGFTNAGQALSFAAAFAPDVLFTEATLDAMSRWRTSR